MAENLFIWLEQGAGDRVQVLRFLGAAASRVQTLWVRDHLSIADLASLCIPSLPGNIEWIVPGETRTAIGRQLLWVPGLSLPAHFSQHWSAPYLRTTAPPEIGTIGLCCFGNRENKLDPVRSLTTEAAGRLNALLTFIGYKVVSLHGSDNADRWFAASGQTTPTGRRHNWRQLVDEISRCEMIVTVDTVISHIAGAMGKPTHLLTYDPSDWRWMTGVVSGWYPTVRIHRKPLNGDWSMAVASLISSLDKSDQRCGAPGSKGLIS
ncbi:MAG: hypothetical protein JHC88_18605 [Niveispirillum sp.]|nr:hypothetical protein [Niveispirillum sp.]